MNLVSSLLGLSVMGIAAPAVLEMSTAPLIAQRKANNFGVAESAAVVFAAANQGATQVGDPPAGCTLNSDNAPAYEVTCTQGTKAKFKQIVSRSFRTNTDTGSDNDDAETRSFEYPINPYGFTHDECRSYEDWGGQTAAFNRVTWQWVAASCEPTPARSLVWYNNSHPNEWRIDINAYNSLPPHPDY